jgi:hypothetical protein
MRSLTTPISLLLTGAAFAQTNTPSTESFLPKGTVTEAVYVQIERDPAFDDYTRRFREAREKNSQWFYEYGKKHEKPNFEPAPYHENFGVAKAEYEHFIHPTNHFREVTRKNIKIHRSAQKDAVQFDFQGDDLLLTKVVLNEEGTVSTQTDILQYREFVDLERASVPPGRTRGPAFRTPDQKVISTKRRESLHLGELKDTSSGIIHYSINTPGQIKMIYIQFPK